MSAGVEKNFHFVFEAYFTFWRRFTTKARNALVQVKEARVRVRHFPSTDRNDERCDAISQTCKVCVKHF